MVEPWGSIFHTLIIKDIVIYFYTNVIYTISHLSLIYDYSYIWLGEPWGCLRSVNVRLEWHCHPTCLSTKLHEQMSSACGDLNLELPARGKNLLRYVRYRDFYHLLQFFLFSAIFPNFCEKRHFLISKHFPQ